jgi:hypothetical protein
MTPLDQSRQLCQQLFHTLYTLIKTAVHHGNSCPCDMTLYQLLLLILLLLLLLLLPPSQYTYVSSYFTLYILLLRLLYIMATPAHVI